MKASLTLARFVVLARAGLAAWLWVVVAAGADPVCQGPPFHLIALAGLGQYKLA
jgi:hypothetical protein